MLALSADILREVSLTYMYVRMWGWEDNLEVLGKNEGRVKKQQSNAC